MLYWSDGFSANRQPTMLKKDGSKLLEESQKPGMSAGDIAEINRLYKCNGGISGITG